ncbi:NADH-quinone oxidoreductase subunit NuoG [Methylonatrum kenyense]|uniref:NADH-quinone oxidoreductase subunit NuoG n=1 Tax=Methylonatrum kenyense TaxID=455253 RepID=UPI0020BF3CB5|nr:NADH-quinone oxidoreductase subunit NuoG [Methylonatrum kenyense]MCK8515913.1 NADH-quinone oxidoreductase subunit NuoG [Methylonatrum kenyense]
MSERAEANNPGLVTIEVDGVEMQAPKGSMIIEATDKGDVAVPRFCYHRKLSIAANCRMCLVDVEKAPKPLPACATPVADGMKIRTRSERALKAQKGVMEFLLINHPLDCPICDQGGECELQDLALGYGRGVSRFSERKRVVKDENLGPLIATEMTRCIHCTRCVRFLDEVAGTSELGGMFRGEHTEISTFVGSGVHSEMSGNIIDLCPVGALTSKPYRFSARSWEMLSHASVSPHDSVGSNLQIHHVRGSIKRVVPRDNEAINECWIADRDRFAYQGLASDERLNEPMAKVDGRWRTVSWDTALELTVDSLRATAAERIGVLAGPQATLEEQYLLGLLLRGLGGNNIDSRLRQSDFSDQAARPAFPWLGLPLESLDNRDVTLVIGGLLRTEQPILNHRLRKAVKAGGRVAYLNPLVQDLTYPADQFAVAPERLVPALAALVLAAAEAAGKPAPDGVAELADQQVIGETEKNLAAALVQAERGLVLLGSLAETHPQAATLRSLAAHLAGLGGNAHGVVAENAASVGAWLAGAVPHRRAGGKDVDSTGLDVAGMLRAQLDTFVLFGTEPELDCQDSAVALQALSRAGNVIAVTPFASDAMKEYASILLPASSFGESAGTLVNAEGRWQRFPGVAAPPGEARPGWKILRVLGNLLELDGFGYNAADEITDELEAVCAGVSPQAMAPGPLAANAATESEGLQRIGLVPLYAGDSLVRRATALQQTDAARDLRARMHPEEAAAQGLDGEHWVLLRQDGGDIRMPLVLDDAVPRGAVVVPAGVRETAGLGAQFGRVAVHKA